MSATTDYLFITTRVRTPTHLLTTIWTSMQAIFVMQPNLTRALRLFLIRSHGQDWHQDFFCHSRDQDWDSQSWDWDSNESCWDKASQIFPFLECSKTETSQNSIFSGLLRKRLFETMKSCGCQGRDWARLVKNCCSTIVLVLRVLIFHALCLPGPPSFFFYESNTTFGVPLFIVVAKDYRESCQSESW